MKKTKVLFALLSLSFVISSCSKSETIPSPEPSTYDPEIISTSTSQEEESSSSSEFEEWVPDIIDYDDPVVIDDIDVDKNTYDYSNVQFINANGEFTCEEGVYTSAKDYSLYVSSSSSSPFTHGTFAVDMKLTTPSDSGLVFGLSTRTDKFWEGKGISYYFFFINFEGVPYLGKTDNGTWSELGTASKVDLSDPEAVFSLKVLWYGNKIICFVNDEIVIARRDNRYLEGTRFGIRTGASGTEFQNLLISSDRVI